MLETLTRKKNQTEKEEETVNESSPHQANITLVDRRSSPALSAAFQLLPARFFHVFLSVLDRQVFPLHG